MNKCINISHPNFLALAREANMNPLILKSKVGVWQENNNTDALPTLEELNKGRVIKPISTKAKPVIIPLTKESEQIYKHYNLLSSQGKVKVLTEQAAKSWAASNNLTAAPYSFVASKTPLGWSIFITEKFTEKSAQGELFGRKSYDKVQSVPTNNEENLISYMNYKKSLLESLEEKFNTYKVQNNAFKNTREYKEMIKKFIKVRESLEKEIKSIDEKDAGVVFKSVVTEIETLTNILKSFTPTEENTFVSELSNLNVDDRMDTLANLFEGKNIHGDDLTKEDIEEGKGLSLLKMEGFENSGAIMDKYKELMTMYKKAYADITRNIIIESDVYKSNIEQLSSSPVELAKFLKSFESLFSSRKDLSIAEATFLGINSVDDSASATAIEIAYKLNIQKSQELINDKCTELTELDSRLTQKGFSLNNFFEKDKYGVDTGNIIHIFSKLWTDKFYEYFDLRKNLRYAHKEGNKKMDAYRNWLSWIRENTNVIDITRLKYFRDAAQGGKYGRQYSEYFTRSEADMEEYEEKLRALLGNYYNTLLEEVEEKLEEFEEYRTIKEIEGSIYMSKNILENSPWDFVRHYYENNGNDAFKPVEIGIEDRVVKTLLTSDYIHFIPKNKSNLVTGESFETGFYNREFDKIQKDETAYAYWDTLRQLYAKHINPTYSSMGHNIASMSFGKFIKEGVELLASKKDGPLMERLHMQLKKTMNDYWADQRTKKSKGELMSKNYSDHTKGLIRNLQDVLKQMSLQELYQMCYERRIDIGEEQMYLNKVQEKALINEISEVIARHDILSVYSKDLTKNTVAISNLAAVQRARMETSMVTEILSRYNETITTVDGKKRSNSINRLSGWVKDNIYGQRPIDTREEGEEHMFDKSLGFATTFSKQETSLMDIVKQVRKKGITDDTTFSLDGFTYMSTKGNYFISMNDEFQQITKESFNTAFEQFLTDKVKDLGMSRTLNSIINGILKVIVVKGLALSPKSGVFNRLEGTLTNMVRDTDGSYWTSGNLNVAKHFMTGINMYRVFSDRKLSEEASNHKKQVETFIQLFEALGVYQDKKNELDRRDNISKYNKIARKFDVFQFAVDLPEFKNQGEITMCMLMDIKVKDNMGNFYDFFDKKTMSFTIFEPGTMSLKEEFRIPENMGWETFHLQSQEKGRLLNEFFVASVKIDDMIKKTQGNYSKFDSIRIHDHTIGRALMVFMRWFPEHIQQRFGTRTGDVIQGKSKVIGRYSAMYNNLPAMGIFGTFWALIAFGPMSPIVPLIGGGLVAIPFLIKTIMAARGKLESHILWNSFNIQVSAGVLQEAIIHSLNFPMDIVHKKTHMIKGPVFKAISLENIASKENTDLTIEEARALKGLAQDIGNMIGIQIIALTLKVMLKALLSGRGDDDDDKEKHSKDLDQVAIQYFYNYVTNTSMRLYQTISSWASPNALVDQNSKFAALRFINDLVRLEILVDRYFTGAGTDAEFKDVMYQVSKVQPVIPLPNTLSGMAFGKYPFFDEEIFQQNKSSWTEKMFKTDEEKAQTSLDYVRGSYKEQLLDYYTEKFEENENYKDLTKQELEIIIKRNVEKRYRQKAYKRPKESYQEALERVQKTIRKEQEIFDKKK